MQVCQAGQDIKMERKVAEKQACGEENLQTVGKWIVGNFSAKESTRSNNDSCRM